MKVCKFVKNILLIVMQRVKWQVSLFNKGVKMFISMIVYSEIALLYCIWWVYVEYSLGCSLCFGLRQLLKLLMMPLFSYTSVCEVTYWLGGGRFAFRDFQQQEEDVDHKMWLCLMKRNIHNTYWNVQYRTNERVVAGYIVSKATKTHTHTQKKN